MVRKVVMKSYEWGNKHLIDLDILQSNKLSMYIILQFENVL